MNLNQWDPVFVWLMALFPQWKVDKGVSAVWYQELKPYAPLDVQEAIRNLMRNRSHGAFPPSVFEIQKEIENLYEESSPPPELAWEEVLEEAEKGKPQLPDYFPNAMKTATRSVGGLLHIGLTPLDQLHWVKRDFIACYDQALQKERREGSFAITDPKIQSLAQTLMNEPPSHNHSKIELLPSPKIQGGIHES